MKSKILKHGYALLFAVLTASIVLGVAAFIVGMSRKQFILSATARDSISSFYNADSAMNCIQMSWGGATTTAAGNTIVCNGIFAKDKSPFINFPNQISAPDGFSSSYYVNKASGVLLFDNNQSCANFDIWVGYDVTTNERKTVIESRGYNTCTQSGTPSQWKPSASTRTVERAIRVTQ